MTHADSPIRGPHDPQGTPNSEANPRGPFGDNCAIGGCLPGGPVGVGPDLPTPDAFAKSMADRWVDVLRLAPPNAALLESWRQLCAEFNAAVGRGRAGTKGKWPVLTPETGTGKTEGTILYCSMLPPTVGVLVVEELIDEAERVARDINRITGDGRAIAVHSKVQQPIPPEQLRTRQVVVVTHAAYLRSLDAARLVDELSGGVADQGTWTQAKRLSSLQAWRPSIGSDVGKRQLIIVDEAPQLIEPASVTVPELKVVRDIVTPVVWGQFPASKRALDLLVDKLETAEAEVVSARERGEVVPHRILWTLSRFHALFGGDHPDAKLSVAAREFFGEFDQGAFRSELQKHGIRSPLQRRKDPDRAKEDQQGLVDIMREVSWLLQGFVLQSTRSHDRRAQEVFSTGRCIVPDETLPAVILDATGQSSPLYRLLPDVVEVRERPKFCRTYGAVTLHVGRLRNVGKQGTLARKDKRVPQLCDALRSGLQARGEQSAGEVLVVAHQAVVTSITAHGDTGEEHGNRRWHVAHWNSFHGKNDYQHCSAVAFFSLLFPNDTTSEVEVNAAQGPHDNGWFASEEAREIRQDMKVRKTANSLVQAINRVRCRRPVDSEGGCLPTDVFLPLPFGAEGDAILALVKEHMPGVRVVPWDLSAVDGASTRRRGPKNVRGAVVRRIAALEPGERVRARDLSEEIGCSRRRLLAVLQEMRDPNSEVGRAAIANRVRYDWGRLERIAA